MSSYLTAKQAAAELDISLPTLYAYVSRGLIRSEETAEKSRSKRYHATDVEKLKSRKALRQNPAKAVQTALHFGTPLLESAITLIENGRLYYRAHDVLELTQTQSFEEVAALIWTGTPDATALFTPHAHQQAFVFNHAIVPGLNTLTPIEQFQAVLPLAAARDWGAFDLLAAPQTGARILNLLAITATNRPVNQNIADSMQQAWAPDTSEAAALINSALILCADHELNVSAFTARCVASAGATPYGAVIAGLAALQGSKHGGQSERVEALFREIGEEDQVRAVIASRLRRGAGIPGFGHKLYPDGDPRGKVLMADVTAVFPHKTALAQTVVDEVQQTIGQQPTIDFALVALARALDWPPGAPIALFALGRTVGWIGHALEQYSLNQLIRPRARYIGAMPKW